MPDRHFLEEYPLYRKFKLNLPEYEYQLPEPAINAVCSKCKSNQTFTLIQGYQETPIDEALKPETPEDLGGSVSEHVRLRTKVFRATYECAACMEGTRHYFLLVNKSQGTVMKVGQWPSWEVTPDSLLLAKLGSSADLLKKGLICESQSYGIAAFAYYRRIVEEIIDSLLNEVADLIPKSEHNQFQEALKQVKATRQTSDKIELVKDLLPDILKPDGINPLARLHSDLSEGLHARSDEECLDIANDIRIILEVLITQIDSNKQSRNKLTESMRRLLERRSQM